MKKFAISLIALAAVSTAALANPDRGSDLRDSDTNFGKYSNQLKNESTSVNALVVVKQRAGAQTAFERMQRNAEENESGSH